ncbi:MAG: phosphatidylserine decarboxylase family protein [Chitinophagaceae bacterium]
MTIHREGYPTIGISFLTLAILDGVIFYFLNDSHPSFCWLLLILSLGLFLFIVSFFRLPQRKMTFGENLVICPADGRVVVIEETFEPEYFKDNRIQVSIFMSPANVHVNRNPVGGVVKLSRYHPGKYLVAWHPKSSTENERHSIVIAHQGGEILVRQIAGALARRIVNYLSVGDLVQQNQEMGFIKFGSRVDIFLPLGTLVKVQLEQPVKGGVNILAILG